MKKFLVFVCLFILTLFLSLTPSLVTHASASSPNAVTSMQTNRYLPDLVYMKNYRAIASDDTEVIIPSVAIDVPNNYNLGGQSYTNVQNFPIPFNYNGTQQYNNIFWSYSTTYNGTRVFQLLLDENPFDYIEFYYDSLVIQLSWDGTNKTPQNITGVRQQFGNGATYSLSYKYWDWQSQAYGSNTESGDLNQNTYLSIIPNYIYNLWDDENEDNNDVPTPSGLVLLKDIVLRVTVPDNTSGSIRYFSTFDGYNITAEDDLLIQFGSEKFQEEPQEMPDIGEWLLDNINSFLAFELVEGFALVDLLGLMVCIPLLLFLFKMVLGG